MTTTYFELVDASGTSMNVYAFDQATADLLAQRTGSVVRHISPIEKSRSRHPSIPRPKAGA